MAGKLTNEGFGVAAKDGYLLNAPVTTPPAAVQVNLPSGTPDTDLGGFPAFHCTGPVTAFVRFSDSPSSGVGSQTPNKLSGKSYYLGTCEQFPIQEEEIIYLPVFDDLSMSASARDKEYAGTNELIVLGLNRFNYNVLNRLLAVPRYGARDRTGAVLPAGQNGHMDRGSLAVAQGLTFELWLFNTFFGSRNWNSYPDMVMGTYYPFCNTITNNTPKQGSGRTQIRMVAIEANWAYYEPEGRWFMKSTDRQYLNKVAG